MEDLISYKRETSLPTMSQMFDRISNLRHIDSWSKLQPPIDSFVSDSKAIQ